MATRINRSRRKRRLEEWRLLDGSVPLSLCLIEVGEGRRPPMGGGVASGLYHALSPGMGWPLADSSGTDGTPSAAPLIAAFGPLRLANAAMLAFLLPFSLLIALVQWQREVQIAASMMLIGFGMFRLINRRHPRVLARIKPTQLALWSFAVAIAHGAGLCWCRSISVTAVRPISIPHMRQARSSKPTSAWPSSFPPYTR